MPRDPGFRVAGFAALVVLAGCPKNGAVGDIQLKGAVQKGPFVLGSTIVVSLLDEQLNPTGQVFNTETSNDRGEFEIAFNATGPVALQGDGYYYNEVAGQLSGSTLTLRAFYVPTSSGTQTAYINIITHLTTQRIMALVRGGMPFTDAVKQAETELRGQLAITYQGFAPNIDAIEMNVAGGDTDNNAYLLGVASVLTQAAVAKGGSVDANVQEIINTLASDMKDGVLNGGLQGEIRGALRALDIRAVAQALGTRLSGIGSGSSVPDMNRVLDQDGDGIANVNDGCPLDPDPLQEDGDLDGVGNACDACPSTQCSQACLPADLASGRPADVCYASCSQPSDCAAGEGCALIQQVSGAPGGPGSPMGLRLCASACDPLTAPSCGAGLGCFALAGTSAPGPMPGPTNGGWFCAPAMLLGTGTEGAECASPNGQQSPRPTMDGGSATAPGCGPGLACAPGLGGVWNCRRPCDPTNAQACQGRACVPATVGDGLNVNLCTPPPGQQDEGCEASPSDTCQAPLVCMDWGQAGCPGQLMRCCKLVGGAGQPCSNQGGCSSGLTCAPGGCAIPGNPGAQCCVQAGGENQPCNSNGACNEGLVCASGPSGYCPNGSNQCCKHAGGPQEPCTTQGRCDADAGLECSSGGACPNNLNCCLPAGGPGEPCNQPNNTCDSPSYRCARSPSCQSGSLGQCCVPAGAEQQPCLSSGGMAPSTCAGDGGLSCVMVDPSLLQSVCGTGECCLQAGDLYQACERNGTCGSGLGCGPSLSDAGQGCLYGLSRCCQIAGGEGQACLSSTDAGMTQVFCNDNTLSCLTNSSCPTGGLSQCCVKSGAVGQPCRPAGSSTSACDVGLACQYSTNTCVHAGAVDEPCRPYSSPGGRCDPGLACNMSTPGNERCVAAGGQGQVCLDEGKCNEGWLGCSPSGSCPTGLFQCCHTIPYGALDQPCGPSDACNASLQCKSIGCQGGLAKCCQAAFSDCASGSCADTTRACVTNAQCAPFTSCCVRAGGELQPCLAGRLCSEGWGLVCTASTACPGGLGECCMRAGGIGQPCLASGACNSGFCVASASCPGGLASCCQATPNCQSDGGCADPARVCAWSNKCGQGSMLTDQCCVPTGGLNQACDAQGQCPSPRTCVAEPTKCPNGLQSCCLQPGAPYQPCLAGDVCNAGAVCVTGNLTSGLPCTGGSALTTCCRPAGGLGERCGADGGCSADLFCVYGGFPGTPAQCDPLMMTGCCKAIPTGDAGQACGPGDTCFPGLVCDPGRMGCTLPSNSASCCQIAGGAGQACYADGGCNAGLGCGSVGCQLAMGQTSCCN